MKRLLWLLLLLLPGVAMADGRDDVANKAMDFLSQGKTDAMVDYLYSSMGRGIASAPVDADVLKLKLELQGNFASQGTYRFYEKVLEQEFSSHLVRQAWLVGFDNGVIRGELWLYRPKDRWFLQSFVFDAGDNAKSKLLEDIKQPGYRQPALKDSRAP